MHSSRRRRKVSPFRFTERLEKGLRVAMELETPGYTRPLGGLGSSVCIPRHRSVSPTNRQLESSSSSSALRDGPPLRLQPRPLGVIKDDNFINCMSAGAAWGAPPLVAPRSAAPARPGFRRKAGARCVDSSARVPLSKVDKVKMDGE